MTSGSKLYMWQNNLDLAETDSGPTMWTMKDSIVVKYDQHWVGPITDEDQDVVQTSEKKQ